MGQVGSVGRPRAGPSPDPVDRLVGQNIRLYRIHLGLTQKQLGDLVGVTFQQVQKYERGSNRLSASKIFKFAITLQLTVEALFDGIDQGTQMREEGAARDPLQHISMDRDTLRLLLAWRTVSPRTRRALLQTLRGLGAIADK